MKILRPAALLVLFLIVFSCKETGREKKPENPKSLASQENEDFRPSFHFSPQEHWMNDPNGMFYLNGTYHLFFQYYPEDNIWGPMHWGHATSKDMVTWKEQEIALKPDEKGYIFSGSAVVDHDNTSGFGDGKNTPIVAMFTYHDPKGEEEKRIDYQSQAIAYSLDEGKTWTKYEANPVIKNPNLQDFRDPKITWDQDHKQWLMVLSAKDRAYFYTSKNLKDWKKVSEFGENYAAQDGVWECPDFFQMQVEGTNETKWVLIQSTNPGGYNGGSGTQYFVGDWDGKNFTPEADLYGKNINHPYWLDFGKDNYAGVTWSNIPKKDGRTLFIGWMSNWLYAQEVPTETWRSAMTIARELRLIRENDDYIITSNPVEELEKYVGETITKWKLTDEDHAIVDHNDLDLTKAQVSFLIPKITKDVHFSLMSEGDDQLKFGFKKEENEFYIDRSESGITDFGKEFGSTVSTGQRISTSDSLKVMMILDNMSVEIFYDDGKTVMTEIFFPKQPYTSLKINEGVPVIDIEAAEFNFD
ncbi:glycoside hydrolase family 32 protein [Zunongwangia sp. HRR-M8]|uniref:glycoside hydrolase family 32 protein n=1 Tax=Zunongwangia sp. HRR-M8 TaxID=3015170 RepID=UPI0022DCFA8E|nr:glycoside hydrolase family 32 protein [Zunongwangia sp. HRR-M8]WBL22484.1 glycoside hydrolase family 32 protein [Zunongwangia sp. HRR-M8]